MNVLSLISVLQSVEREFQSLAQTKDSELAEAQQQLRQNVSVKSFLVISEMILQYSKYFLTSVFMTAGGTATIQ